MHFQVVFTGALRDGFSRRQGIETLAKQFSLDFQQIKHLLSGVRPVVKRTRDRQQAERFVEALWNGGWHSELHQGEKVLMCTNQSLGHEEPVVAAGMVRRVSADSSISLQLPESWQICTELNPHALFQAGDRDSHKYVVVLRQSSQGLPENLELADYCAAQLKQCVAKVVAGEVLSESARLNDSELPAYVAKMAADLNGVAINYIIGCLQWRQWFYTIFLWCEERDFEQEEELFLNLVRGFRIESEQAVASEDICEAELI